MSIYLNICISMCIYMCVHIYIYTCICMIHYVCEFVDDIYIYNVTLSKTRYKYVYYKCM